MANDKKKHTFNLDKAEKRTFNLDKEVEEEIDTVVPAPQPEKPEDDSGKEETGSKKPKGVITILVICVLAAIGLLIWWLVPGDREETVAPDSEGIADTTTASGDSAAAPENALPQDAATIDEAAAPAQGADNGEAAAASEATPATAPVPAPEAAPAPPAQKAAEAPSGSIDEQAQKAIRGVYGNGRARRNNLGSSYREVQDRVNEMLKK